MIKVLIVDDSETARQFLTSVLDSDAKIRVIGTAPNGREAINFLNKEKPDVIVMDVNMPVMDGLQTTKEIMATCPVPIVMVTATGNPDNVSKALQALQAGAVALLDMSQGLFYSDHEALATKLVQTVKAMSEVKVIRRWSAVHSSETTPFAPSPSQPTPRQIKLVAIGASTGGPPVIQTILGELPKDLSVPVLIVQHMAEGFLEGLARWLQQTTGFPVEIATNSQALSPGHAYLGPDGYHLGVQSSVRIVLAKGEATDTLCPSISYLFDSVANSFGSGAISILLSGMGVDGAEGLKLMRNKGAITIAQDPATCVVDSMPQTAIKLGAAMHVLPPDKIAPLLAAVLRRIQ